MFVCFVVFSLFFSFSFFFIFVCLFVIVFWGRAVFVFVSFCFMLLFFVCFFVDYKRRIVLFNDALNTFYLRLYGIEHIVKENSDSEKGNPLPPCGLLFLISSKDLLYQSSHRHDSTYHGVCCTTGGMGNVSMCHREG